MLDEEQVSEQPVHPPADSGTSVHELHPEERLAEGTLAEGTALSEDLGESLPEDLPESSRESTRESTAEHAASSATQAGQPAEQEVAEPALERRPGDLWPALRAAIRRRVQPEQFETWFRRASLTHVDDDRLRLAVQNDFARDWLRTYYRDVLVDAATEVLGSAREIEIWVDSELTIPERSLLDDDDLEGTGLEGTGSATDGTALDSNGASGPHFARPRQAADEVARQTRHGDGYLSGVASRGRTETTPGNGLENGAGAGGSAARVGTGLLWNSDIALNPKYTFDNFVVGPCNRFAHAASVGASEIPGKNYNPFFLHGSVGLGKTHLLQSICYNLLDRDPQTRILYLSCETFVNHFISSLENGEIHRFRDKYRNVDVLVVDDIHLLANKERTQEEFFHTFNTLYQANKQIVLSSDSPPKDIPTLHERLVSRFKWGLVTEIEPPCYETRMAILKRKSRERGHEVPDSVARLLAERIESNIRELEGAVTRVLGYASLSSQPVTTSLVREVLKDVFTLRRGQPSMDEILRAVTDHFGVKLTDLQSRKRTNAVAFPRQIAMYLARRITQHSLEEVGGYFGGRDHSTVLYAVEKIRRLSKEDTSCRQALERLLDQLRSAPERGA